MNEFKRLGVDTSEAVFTLHGIGQQDKFELRRDLGRAGLETFWAKLVPTEVALEACGGSHPGWDGCGSATNPAPRRSSGCASASAVWGRACAR